MEAQASHREQGDRPRRDESSTYVQSNRCFEKDCTAPAAASSAASSSRATDFTRVLLVADAGAGRPESTRMATVPGLPRRTMKEPVPEDRAWLDPTRDSLDRDPRPPPAPRVPIPTASGHPPRARRPRACGVRPAYPADLPPPVQRARASSSSDPWDAREWDRRPAVARLDHGLNLQHLAGFRQHCPTWLTTRASSAQYRLQT